MSRKKEVTVLQEVTEKGVTVVIKEKTLGQLEEMLTKVAGVQVKDIIQANDIDHVKNSLMSLFTDNIPELFPPIKPEQVKSLYPSEIEELVEGFIEVNFFGVKRLAVPLMSVIRQQINK